MSHKGSDTVPYHNVDAVTHHGSYHTPHEDMCTTLDQDTDATPAKQKFGSNYRSSVKQHFPRSHSDSTPFLTLGGSRVSTENPCRSLFNYNGTSAAVETAMRSNFASRSNTETSTATKLDTEGHSSTENPCGSGSLFNDTTKTVNSARTNTISRSNSVSRSSSSGAAVARQGSSDLTEGLGLGTSISNNRSRQFRAPFSRETPCFNKETQLILATARQTGSAISTSCNRDSIRQLQNPGSYQQSITSSDYFFKNKTQSTAKVKGLSSAAHTSFKSTSFSTSLTGDDDDDDVSSDDIGQMRTTDRTSLSSDSQVYLGVMWHAGKVGVAYYDVDTTKVQIMLDTQETDEFKLLLRVIKQVNPAVIILSSKQDERLLRVLRTYVSEVTNTVDTTDSSDNMLQFLPSIDFSIEICKRRVLSMDLPSIPDHYMDTERTLYLSSLIPFENSCMVRAMGGLLKYLEKMRIGIELEEAGTKLPVLDVSIFTLDSQMVLDDTAYSALQIFQRESHPSVYKAGTSNSAKEGLSLFGIMNRTKSQIGSNMLRTWFQRPLKDLEMIRGRHDAISYFNNPRNIELVQTLEESVKHVKNISKILTRMMQSEASVGDWQALYKTVYNATCIKEVCRVQSQNIDIFKKVSEKFSDDLHKITNFINKIVDFQESGLQGRFVVKPNVDARLDKKKRIFSGLPDFMTKVAHEELNKLGDEVTECSVLYMPQIGYLLAIPETALRTEPDHDDSHQIEGLEFVGLRSRSL